MRVSDFFAELYVAGRFVDAGWNVYFPRRDRGFDFIVSKTFSQRDRTPAPRQYLQNGYTPSSSLPGSEGRAYSSSDALATESAEVVVAHRALPRRCLHGVLGGGA